MPFRRTFVAGLAPLIGLSAILAAIAAGGGLANSRPQQGKSTLVGLLRAVVHTPTVESSSTSISHDRSATQAVLTLEATPLRHSLWMVSSVLAINILARRHQRPLLRC